jgi:hypothetical protein
MTNEHKRLSVRFDREGFLNHALTCRQTPNKGTFESPSQTSKLQSQVELVLNKDTPTRYTATDASYCLDG